MRGKQAAEEEKAAQMHLSALQTERLSSLSFSALYRLGYFYYQVSSPPKKGLASQA